ncbi:MAG: sigma-70 family RNA polymerase sigma factor [Candidatus Eisenbacteria bacterium]|uniref:Sigma-70 family RNA polymerase sigma factor n=1 Tax=Eiseniibacteriota bacterium TaxID=2212470 RepID=A0A956RQ41_UNCEI|nr:sigma-70 family RNA polymerase sigma factor [Candidatus Eisenbacteria bacterium]
MADWLRETAVADGAARDRALPIVYAELRAIAASYIRDERPDHTLQPTALTHEAYLRLRESAPLTWKSRAHLIALAARAMRRTLVDHARAQKTQKRGGEKRMLSLDLVQASSEEGIDVMELDRALEELGEQDPRKLRIVEMLYFGGLAVHEAAEVLEVSRRTVERDWRYARAWLLQRLHRTSP